MSKILTIANQKGGVSKTSSVLNLAYALGLQGKRVLVLDLDPQSSLTVCFGAENHEHLETTVYDLMLSALNDEPLPPKVIYETIAPSVTRSEAAWKDYLRFGSRIYKHQFDNALLVYAQNPKATMLATTPIWNKINRYVNRGEKGIPRLYRHRVFRLYKQVSYIKQKQLGNNSGNADLRNSQN